MKKIEWEKHKHDYANGSKAVAAGGHIVCMTNWTTDYKVEPHESGFTATVRVGAKTYSPKKTIVGQYEQEAKDWCEGVANKRVKEMLEAVKEFVEEEKNG